MKNLQNYSPKNYFYLTIFGLFILLIFMAPITSAVVASGSLSYDNNKRNIQHFEGGIVEKLLVKNGDEVKKNQEIIRLSSIKNIADKKIIQWKLLSMILQKQFLELEGRGIDKIDNQQIHNRIKFLISNFSSNEKNEFTYLVANSQQYLKATINKYLKETFDVIEKWGFKFSCVLVWCKPKHGIGLGGTFIQTTEYLFFCRKGSLKSNKRIGF
jgi:hypothetical protein